jgi:signal transduction histidine kinase
MDHLYGWPRRHPLVTDGLMALLLFALSAGEWGRDIAAAAVSAALAATALPRRRHPVAAFGVVTALAVVQIVVGITPSDRVTPVRALDPVVADLVIIVLIYSVAAYRSRRVSTTCLLIYLAGLVLALSRWAPAYRTGFGGPLLFSTGGLIAMGLAAWVLGDSMAYRRAYNAALEERAARLEAERDAQARIAAAAERARIAREIHDVIAHNVSVMVVQADGASYALDGDPERSREALAAISGTGRQALAELRHLLGVLHTEDEEVRFAPLPGVGQLDALIAQVRAAGLPVSFAVEGTPRPMADGPALAAYRVVQESLTNTRRHAGLGATASVTLRYGDDGLRVRVADTGAGVARPAGERGGAGHGLAGMRERAALYGGTVRAGPRPEGGYEVTAELPLSARDAA